MAFWDDVRRNVSSFFGGNQKKKDDEENQRQSSSPSIVVPKPVPTIQTQQPRNAFQASVVPTTASVTLGAKPTNSVSLPKPPQPVVKATPEEANQIPGFRAMSPQAQQKALDAQRAKNKVLTTKPKPVGYINEKDQENLKTIGNIPLVGTAANWGARLAAGFGKITGNKSLEDDANNRSRLLSLGMNTEEYNQYDQETKDKLDVLQNVVTGAGALDILGASSLVKAPIISGSKAAAKEGFTTAAGKQILKDSIKETGKQYGKNIAGGAVVSGIADPAIQAYVKNGEVDWTSVPSSMLQGGLWAAALPEFSGKARLVQKMRAGDVLTPDESQILNDVIKQAGGATPTQIQVRQPRDISVIDRSEPEVDVEVTSTSSKPTPQPIVEVRGDTPGVNQVKTPTIEDILAKTYNKPSNPDRRVEGFTRRDTGTTGGFTRAEINAERKAVDDALVSGELDPEAHKTVIDELDSLVAVDDTPKGAKIQVKQVQSIPVTEVPTNLPETPGTVRATQSAAPNNARSANVASNTVVLPPEVQQVLDNPKQFNKRQVASARNQAKLAKQFAKTQEQTAEAMRRIETASPAAQSGEGFVPTGQFAKGKNKNIYQKTNRQAEMEQAVSETASLSPQDVIASARTNADQNGGGFNRRDIRNIAALFETKRIPRGTPEYEQARQILKEDGTNWGQTGALRNYTIRRNASADELISRFESKIYRLADDPSKIDSKLFDQIDEAETKFVETRDAAMQAYNRFTQEPTSANAQAYHVAQDAAEAADKAAKTTEYKVANQALKGNKDIQQVRELEKMAQQADMYQMDAVDASMLSSTGTFVRNLVNASVGGAEEGLFGGIASRIAGKLTKQNVGGGVNRGNVEGLGEGALNIVDASKARASEAKWNPLEHAKNWATTGNQLGDAVIDSQTKGSVLDHYTQDLKAKGFKGRELRDRASVLARQDPDNVAEIYQTSARIAAGLGSGITRNNKIETTVKNILSDAISGGNPNAATENVAKLATRMVLGFPTAIGRSVAEGAKRFTLGFPTFVKAFRTQDPQTRAVLIKEGIKQAGSGGVAIPATFAALGASGIITGAYPSDESERERWQREGITENSIKIGDDYYQLPAYLGSWALPALYYASLGRNGGDVAAAALDTAKIVPALLPTDQMNNWLDVVNGRADLGKFMAQTGASAVRAATPVGALLNQIAKSFDPTQNDTNSGTVWENFLSKVGSGIPGVSNTLPDKTDAEGNVLVNPDPLAIGLGASSTVQGGGVERTAELTDQSNTAIQSMNQYGAFNDPNLKAVLTDEDTLKIYNDITAGKQPTPDELKKLQNALVKGVSSTGDDTAYLEKEQYDSNLTALNLKRDLMQADPTTKPSDLKKIETAIARGIVYRDNEIPYDLISEYQTVGVDEWRNMGDPEDEAYNPEMYQALWAIDEALTKAGASYKKGDLTKQKYSEKKAGSGKGRGGSRSFSSDFGTLKAGTGAPKVQAYESLDQRSGGVPIIQVKRPNIVHKISSSG